MNFLLKDIELIIDDVYIEKAEILLEGSRLGNMVEIDNNLWIGLVMDGRTYEIEVQLQNKKVKAYTCECDTYKKDEICEHITAGLILLRTKNPYVPKPNPSIPVKKSSKKLTVAAILEQTPDDELKSFVRQYARHNRKFALDLKTRFVGYVTSISNEQKYNQLLESALNGVFRSYNEISKLGMDHLLKIYEELYVQIEEHIAMKNYQEAIDIMASLFKGLPSLLRRKGAHRDILFPMIEDLCKTSSELFKSRMAPELHNRLWDILFDQAQISIYCHLGFEQPIFSVLVKKCNIKSRFTAFSSMVEDLLDFFSDNLGIKAKLIQYLYTVYVQNKQDSTAFFQQYLQDELVLKLVISNLLHTHHLKDAKRLAKMGINANPNVIQAFLEESLLQIALQSNQNREIIKYATSRFLDTYKMEYYEILKTHSDDIGLLTTKLISNIKHDRKGFSTLKMLGILMIEIEDTDGVIDLLKSHNELKLIMEFDKYLAKSNQKALLKVYLQWIDNYLKEHFGPAPIKKIQSIVHHLYAIHEDRFARRLVEQILKSYPERQFLNKTLMVF